MAMRHLTNRDADGTSLGYNTSDLITFYGGTARAQPSGTYQGQITDGSTGTANISTGIAALTGSYNSTLLINALATLTAGHNALAAALVSLNLIKGSA